MVENLFNLESGADQEFSNALGRRKKAKSKGLKAGTRSFRQSVRAQRKSDKSKKMTKPQKKLLKKKRQAGFDEAVVTGKVNKNLLGKAFGVAKKGYFAPMRGSALALIRLNLWGIATKMGKLQKLSPNTPAAKTAWIKILAHWIKFGGNKDSLIKGIDAGKGKKQLLTRNSKQVVNPFNKPRQPINPNAEKKEFAKTSAKEKNKVVKKSNAEGFDYSEINGFDEEFNSITGVETATLIASSATVLSSIVSILKKNSGLVGDMPLTDADNAQLGKNAVPELTTEDIANGAEAAGASAEQEKEGENTTSILIIAGTLLLGLYLISNKKNG